MKVTTTQATKIFGVHKSTLTAWKRAGAVHCYVGKNEWDLPALIQWWAEFIYTGPSQNDPQSLAAAKEKYWQARAEREELGVRREKNMLISRDEVGKAWGDRMAYVRATLFLMLDRLPAMLEGKKRSAMRVILDKEFGDLLNGYCKRGKHCEGANPIR